MNFQNLLRKSLLSASIVFWTAHSAHAFNVHDAMILAHENNYQVLAEAENFQATKLAKPKAYTGFLPSASVSRSFDNVNYQSAQSLSAGSKSQIRNDNLTVTQPIFSGGSTYYGVKSADHQVKAGQSRFKSISNEIAFAAVQAYENLLTAYEIYNLSLNNEKVLKTNLSYTQTRFKHGEVTKTDVLQAEARYAAAIAERERADGEVVSTRANLERIIGFQVPPKMETINAGAIDIPKSFDEFLKLALAHNPSLLSAKQSAKAFEQNVNVAYSKILPTVNASAVLRRSSKTGVNNDDSNTYSINVSVPIFQNGSEYVNISETKHLSKKATFDYRETERQVRESATRAWSNLKVARALIKSRNETIEAASKALAGVKEEAKIGTRTTLDILDAEQELYSAKVALRTTQKDYILAAFNVLQIMGAIELFDPTDIIE